MLFASSLSGIRTLRGILLLVWLLSPLSALFGQEGKPIALVGDSYGSHEVTSIIRNILDHEDWLFEQRGTFLPAEEFKNYSIVVIAHAQERPYTAQEHALIREYLENGGRVLLIQQAPKSLADDLSAGAFFKWFGMKQSRIREIDPAEAVIANDKVLAGVIAAEGARPSWISGDQGVDKLADDIEVLIGAPDRALVARRKVGRGEVYFLGNELFRLRLPRSKHVADSDSYVTLVRNVLADAAPQTGTAWHQSLAKDWETRQKRFLLWNREWERGTEKGAIFKPPLPSEDELVTKLSVPLAADEYEALQLNLTDLGTGGLVTWTSDLGGLPANALSVFVQDRPDPIPWPKNPEIAREVPFWLMPPEAIEPKGRQGVMITSGGTRIFWLKFDSHGLAPGKYQGSIRFAVDGQPAGTVALEIEVYPVRAPKRRAITVKPAGHVYGDVNKTAPALRFKRNLRDLGFEWSLINTLRPETFTVNGAKLDAKWLRDNVNTIVSEQPPMIDFSSMDEFLDAALAHNLTYFRVTQHLTESINKLTQKLPLTEEQKKAIRQWYLREFARYIKDKGIRHAYVGMGDELSGEELRNRFIPWSEDLAEAGWLSTSTFTTASVADPELTKDLSKTVGSWTLNRLHIGTFMKALKSGEITLPKGALVGTYGAGEGRGTEVRKNASSSRMVGWESWAQGTDYSSPNPYFKSWLYYSDYSLDRGVGGERFVSFLDQDNLDAPLVNSPFIEGIRESMEEANLAWAMKWYLDKLGDQVPQSLRDRAAKIVTDEEQEGILHWKTRKYGTIESKQIFATRDQYQRAKAEVLEILDALRPLVVKAGLAPDVFWNQIPLFADGKPVATLTGDAAAAAPIQTAMQDLDGHPLPVAEKDFPAKGTVLFVGTKENSVLPPDVRDHLGPHLPEASWIREIPDGDRVVIWIGGTSEQQVEKAVGRFVHFLRAPASVFVK
jgi:hypothetical protein